MKTRTRTKLLLIICSAVAISAHAQVTNSSYTGPDMGNWGLAENWSPAAVPNNSGGMTFNVSINDHSVTLDIDPTISSLSLGGAASVTSVDHSLASAATSVTPTGLLNFHAQNVDVVVDAGTLADFTGTTLTGGTYILATDAGRTASLKFNGADIRTNSAYVSLFTEGTRVVDQNGADAFRNLAATTVEGILEFQNGQHITTPGSFTNNGYFAYYAGSSLTVNGDLINTGDSRDPGTVGFVDGLSRDGKNSLVLVKGVLPNYDAATKTLSKGRYFFGATPGTQNTLQVLGGPLLDIVHNDASLILIGQNTGFRDSGGADALRNLAVTSRYLVIGGRSFATPGSLTNTDILVFLGDSDVSVPGNLINSGILGTSVVNPYLNFFNVAPGLPIDPPAQSTEVNVTGALTLQETSTLSYEIYGPSAQGVVNVTGAATFDGALEILVLDYLQAPVGPSDTFTLLMAGSINGTFSNVASGQRVTALKYSDFTPIGSFLVTYGGTTLQISDYQALPELTGAVSRKLHGNGQSYDIDLLAVDPGVESRSSNGNHTLVFTFSKAVAGGNATIMSGTATVNGTPTFSGNTMTVNLTGVANAQTVTVKLSGVTDPYAQVLPDLTINAGFLLGDTTGDRIANSGDATQTRNRSGQPMSATTFRADVNTDGAVNSGDAAIVRNQSGTSITP